MLDALSIPPRLVKQALDDLHSIAADIGPLTEAARVLPRTEDELSANIAALRDDIQALHGVLQPIHRQLSELDTRITELQTMLRRLPGI
jgi:septal ring factor EnvC (AmiA/AmiB activator)